ncbi:hypothetical protein PC128_g25214 [Phytophthora cactorum]|nr:hypothetical protein PC120_g24931 [Phytophthora cactorum]KAG3042719.1 hypothetical protein PC121_g22997 [Phytophthora cactorum]KAG3140300.1 hypothetical protein PC128_g25214 [Phytophthora cactorum]KAG4038877.1 hypothetical protein PC123_g25565 [Phytophthora cactorum]
MSATSTRKRAHVSDSDRGGSGEEAADSTVSVPAFEGEFSSWDAFHKEFKRYQEETHQLYKTRTTNSVAERNRRRTLAARERGITPALFNESFAYGYL